MIKIQDEIEIVAPPEVVWATLTDFERYAIWNPFIRRVEAPVVGLGEKLEAFLHPSGQRGVPIRPIIRVYRPPTELHWNSYFIHPNVLYGEHTFRLRATATGTVFFQRLVLGGLLAPLVGNVIESDTLRGIEEMNAALKVHVEGFHGTSAARTQRATAPD
ncbi:MAG: SRPBCC domain-containing protein [Litorilinea sp.]